VETHLYMWNSIRREEIVTRAAIVFLFLLPVSSWADLMPILDITGGGTAVVPLAAAVGG